MSDIVSIEVAGRRITGWTGVTIVRAIDTCADAFSISMPFDPERADLRERFRPFKYQLCKVYIDDELIITGSIDKIEPAFSVGGQTLTVQGRNKTGVIVDCYIDGVGYQYNGYALSTVIKELTKNYGIHVHAENDTNPIQECAAEPGQKIFEFASKLAEGFGLFLSSNEKGWLIISYPPKAGTPVASIVAGQSPCIGGSSSYDGTARYSRYKVVGSDYGTPGVVGIADDPGVSIYRRSVETLGSSTPREAQKVAERKRALALAGAASVTVVVSGWRDGNGNIWGSWRDKNGTLQGKGATVTLLAPALMVYTETAFVVAGVTLKIDETQGKVSELRLVLPQTFEDKMPEVYPWD